MVKNMPINEHERNKILREEFKKQWDTFKKHHKSNYFIKSFIEENPEYMQIGIETKFYNIIAGKVTPNETMLNHLIKLNETKLNEIEKQQQNQNTLEL